MRPSPASKASTIPDRDTEYGEKVSQRVVIASDLNQARELEERLLETHLPGWRRRALRERASTRPLRFLLTQIPQRAEERRSALARLRLLQSERIFAEMLAFSGRGE